MHEVDDSGESGSGEDIKSEDKDIGRISQKSKRGLITQANNYIRLYTILTKNGLKPVHKYNQKWSEPLQCPFEFHKNGKEKTPSFHYNFVEDRFHCFGCQSSGRSVEFISFFKDVDKNSIALNILKQAESYGLEPEFDTSEDIEDVSEPLFEFAAYLNEVYSKSDDVDYLEDVDKVVSWFDNYIDSFAPDGKVKLNDLVIRIEKVKELIEG